MQIIDQHLDKLNIRHAQNSDYEIKSTLNLPYCAEKLWKIRLNK